MSGHSVRLRRSFRDLRISGSWSRPLTWLLWFRVLGAGVQLVGGLVVAAIAASLLWRFV